jgi:hypothetical protein
MKHILVLVLVAIPALGRPACVSYKYSGQANDILGRAFVHELQESIQQLTTSDGTIDGLQACEANRGPDLEIRIVTADPFHNGQAAAVSVVAVIAGKHDIICSHQVLFLGQDKVLGGARETSKTIITDIENAEGPSWRYLLWQHANEEGH